MNKKDVCMSKFILFSTTFLTMIILQNNSEMNATALNASKDISENNLNTETNEKSPQKIVLSLFNDYFIPIKEKTASENEKLFTSAVKEIIAKYFDIKKIVNTILGPNKNKFSDSEKAEFTEVLIEKMSRVYGKQFSEFEDIKNFEINNVTNSVRKRDAKKCSIVTSSVIMKGEKIELLWFFLENDNHEMKIVDIKVAGISLTQNWIEQVRSLITANKEIKKFLNNFK